MAKPERRDPDKEKHWRGLLRAWRRSGLTGRDFCAKHQLSEPSFYAWRREIARRDREKPVCVKPMPRPTQRARRPARPTAPATLRAAAQLSVTTTRRSAAGGTSATLPAFVNVAVGNGAAAATPAIEVVVAERRVLRVRAGFDADLLRQLVRLLEEAAC